MNASSLPSIGRASLIEEAKGTKRIDKDVNPRRNYASFADINSNKVGSLTNQDRVTDVQRAKYAYEKQTPTKGKASLIGGVTSSNLLRDAGSAIFKDSPANSFQNVREVAFVFKNQLTPSMIPASQMTPLKKSGANTDSKRASLPAMPFQSSDSKQQLRVDEEPLRLRQKFDDQTLQSTSQPSTLIQKNKLGLVYERKFYEDLKTTLQKKIERLEKINGLTKKSYLDFAEKKKIE